MSVNELPGKQPLFCIRLQQDAYKAVGDPIRHTEICMDLTAGELMGLVEESVESIIGANAARDTCLFCEQNIMDGNHDPECWLVEGLSKLLREVKR